MIPVTDQQEFLLLVNTGNKIAIYKKRLADPDKPLVVDFFLQFYQGCYQHKFSSVIQVNMAVTIVRFEEQNRRVINDVNLVTMRD